MLSVSFLKFYNSKICSLSCTVLGFEKYIVLHLPPQSGSRTVLPPQTLSTPPIPWCCPLAVNVNHTPGNCWFILHLYCSFAFYRLSLKWNMQYLAFWVWLFFFFYTYWNVFGINPHCCVHLNCCWVHCKDFTLCIQLSIEAHSGCLSVLGWLCVELLKHLYIGFCINVSFHLLRINI